MTIQSKAAQFDENIDNVGLLFAKFEISIGNLVLFFCSISDVNMTI